MIAVTSTNTSGSTRKFASAAFDSARPKKISFDERTWTFSWIVVMNHTTATRRSGKNAMDSKRRLRPSRIPSPMPRKLAISTKLLKKPM